MYYFNLFVEFVNNIEKIVENMIRRILYVKLKYDFNNLYVNV